MELEEGFRFSFESIIFDVIKIRKRFKLFPLKVEFGFDWHRQTGEKAPFIRVQGTCDKMTALSPSRGSGYTALHADYCRKAILSPMGSMNVRAGFLLKGLWDRQPSPFIGLSYNIGAGQNNVAQLTSGNGVDFRTRLPLAKMFEVEVCGNVKLPLPAAQYEEREGNGSIGFGEGSMELNIAQLNPVIYV